MAEILVVDVEATCWDGPVPAGQQNEIIEIGVCVLDTVTGARSEPESILVRPERSQVSAFCTQLTTLTPEMVAAGVPFHEACARLQDRYHSRERLWASYGEYDRKQFLSQCASFGVEYPFGPEHLNVKKLFAREHALRCQVGMAGALRHLGVELKGTHHRGGDDAWNIAGILADLLSRRFGNGLSVEDVQRLAAEIGTAEVPL